jgi:hypothetical protein
VELVYIDDDYTDFLRKIDRRVSYNIDKDYRRPYVGVVFALKKNLYFAPLTSHNKGKKLAENPKKESITFYPIKNCELGGININNMIPIVKGVYHKVDYTPDGKDPKWLKNKKLLMIEQISIINKNESYIRRKAILIYNMKIQGKLYPNYDNVTCDFKKLETQAMKYKI